MMHMVDDAKTLTPNPFPRGKGNNREERGGGTGILRFALNDTRTEPESERSSSTFRDFFSLGAGVTPAQGSLKPTVGFILN
jgi:hypothetical protein